MSQTPSSNYNDNSAPGAAAHAADPQSHSVKLMSIRPLPFSSSQESMKDGDLLRKGRKRKATTQDIEISPNGQHEIENTHITALPFSDYTCHDCQYAKDRLTGKITCMVCGEEGHYTCDCSMKSKERNVICTICNRAGHCHLWCCRQNVSENRACRRCGEKGHYTKKRSCGQRCGHDKDISCSSCDANHPLGKCPMRNIRCFICEGKNHVPAKCHLSPMLTAVIQYRQESFRAALKKAMTETRTRTLTPVKPSAEFSHDEEVPKVSNFSSSGHGHSERNNTIRSEVPDSDKTSHATRTVSKSHECQFKGGSEMVPEVSRLSHGEEDHCDRKSPGRSQAPHSDKANHAAIRDNTVTPVSKGTCFNCHEEGHCANKCPKTKPPEELELHDATHINVHANSCPKKKTPGELELSDVTCFNCHDKGHKSYSCPKKSPVELKLSDVTCFKCHEKGHKSYCCPKQKSPGKLKAFHCCVRL
ncbi:unnamed protein product [Urochloa humidicola]